VAGEGERTIRGEIRELGGDPGRNMTLALEREILAAENERNKRPARPPGCRRSFFTMSPTN
jgi:hypothetical protein